MTPSDPAAVFLGALLLLAGIAGVGWMRRRLALAQSSRSWPTASGRVVVASYRSRAAAVVAKYTPGAEVPVFYDPARPARAVLEPGTSGAYNYGLVGCAFILVGLFVLIYLGFLRR